MTRLDLRPNQLSNPCNASSQRARVMWPARTTTRQLWCFFGAPRIALSAIPHLKPNSQAVCAEYHQRRIHRSAASHARCASVKPEAA